MNSEKVYFGAGCFWGVEYYFQKLDGVLSTKVGFMGGSLKNPSYRQVCTENTGHVEVVEVEYDPSKVDFLDLAKLFFEIHDTSQFNRQGPDVGLQYRSEVFFTILKQKEIVLELIEYLKKNGFKVLTKLTQASDFYLAEDYHQHYYFKNGKLPYCHARVKKFF